MAKDLKESTDSINKEECQVSTVESNNKDKDNNTNKKKEDKDIKTVAIKKENKEKVEKIYNPIVSRRYKVVVDLDKDLDIILCYTLLNQRNIKALIENDTITCGLYSHRSNANNTVSKITALGFNALILEV